MQHRRVPPVPGHPQRRRRGRRGPRRGPAAGPGTASWPGAASARRYGWRSPPRSRDQMLDLLVRELDMDDQDVLRVPGLLDLSALWQVLRRVRPARPQGPAVRAGHPPPAGRGRGAAQRLRDPARRRRPRAPPVPLLRHQRAALHRAGRRRPAGAGHQADALPHQRRLADRRRAHRRGRGRQAGGGAGRGEGPLRRGGQHRLGAHAGTGRLPRRVRPGRPEDALQDRAGGAPGGRPDPPLLPHRHRQLPPEDRPALRGPRPAHRRPGGRRGPDRPVQRSDRATAGRRRTGGCWWRRRACAAGWSSGIEEQTRTGPRRRPRPWCSSR